MSEPPSRDKDWMQQAFSSWKRRLHPSPDFERRLAQRLETAQREPPSFAPSAQEVLGGFFSEVVGLFLEDEAPAEDPPEGDG